MVEKKHFSDLDLTPTGGIRERIIRSTGPSYPNIVIKKMHADIELITNQSYGPIDQRNKALQIRSRLRDEARKRLKNSNKNVQ